MAINFFKAACDLFGRRGQVFYRNTIDNGKVIAPVAVPIVESILQSRGLPIDGAGAVRFLAQQVHLSNNLPASTVNAVAAFALEHLAAGSAPLPVDTAPPPIGSILSPIDSALSPVGMATPIK